MTAFTSREFPDSSIVWRLNGDEVPFWRRATGIWVINYRAYPFNEWLDLVKLPEEEKVMLKLRFG